jgi:hypothetical protein
MGMFIKARAIELPLSVAANLSLLN